MFQALARLWIGIKKNILHREIGAANSNTTQKHGNNRKQLELVKVINIIQVVSV